MLTRLLGLLRGNWTLKLVALGLAFLLWSVVRAESPTRVTLSDVPVRVVLRDADWITVGQPLPATVNVVFSGPVRELMRLFVQRPELIVPIDQVSDTVEIHVLRTGWVSVQPGLDNTRVEDVRPSTARFAFDRLASRLVPLSLPLSGELRAGLEMVAPIRIDPPAVNASGASRRLARIDSLRLPSIDLRDIRGFDTLGLVIDTAGLGLNVSPRTVRVIVPARSVADTIAPPASPPSPAARGN
jgi:YbbR domain-containing protein